MTIEIQNSGSETIDVADNAESAVSVLYGDLSTHEGTFRYVICEGEGPQVAEYMRYEARINADCWDIPEDKVIER